jgi:3-deoxy-D-manno-octulosonate 8-phosphate phosphatase (KDO 8-P phosphatase)
MRLIAHRGNYNGPDPERENTVAYLEAALKAGFDVELDVFCENGVLYLGHDRKVKRGSQPVIEMGQRVMGWIEFNRVPSIEWLRDSRKWVHCKDQASYDILSVYQDCQCFMHDTEPHVSVFGYRDGYLSWVHGDQPFPPDRHAIIHQSKLKQDTKPGDYYGVYGHHVGQLSFLDNRNLPIKTVLIDVDGVMTRGVKTYDSDGDCKYKEFCDKDWTAIKRMQAAGLRVALISADWWNHQIAHKRRVEFIHADTTGPKSKLNVIRQMGIDLDTAVYIGDDYYDLELMWHVARSYCPADAETDVRECSTTLPTRGGENCIEALYQAIRYEIRENFPHEPA